MRAAAVLVAVFVLQLGRTVPTTVYNVYAVRYATIADFPVSSLVAGADAARRADIAMMVWLLEADDGQSVLFDAGFASEEYLARWKPRDYVRPDEAVARLGSNPEDVYNIVVSHVHWDHLDGVSLFPSATVWLQRGEYAHYVDAAGRPKDRGIDARGAALLHRLRREGQLELVDGGGKEILPGITAHVGGRHTHQSQYISVRTSGGTVVLASDNAYLYENLERRVPIAQTVDAASNRRSQARMLALAGDPRWVVPGHDPLVFERFPRVAEGIAAIPR
jgi:glyoxylase-like metal-dependent hydrolase (beta-lactamase superfamily II)